MSPPNHAASKDRAAVESDPPGFREGGVAPWPFFKRTFWVDLGIDSRRKKITDVSSISTPKTFNFSRNLYFFFFFFKRYFQSCHTNIQ